MLSGGAQLDAICRLAVMFIANVNVSGYSVTANVHSKVDSLLAVTSQHVLTLLHRRCISPVNSHLMLISFSANSVYHSLQGGSK